MGKSVEKTNRKRTIEAWSVNDLISAVDAGNLDLDTEYQRDPIWDKDKKALLIDSILHDIDIPKIYLAYFTAENRYECIDGKQRIMSILDFYNNIRQTASGEYYKDLKDKSIFLNYKFTVSILQDPTDDDILNLFYRLNIGKPLNGGEMIHAMSGNMRDFVFNTIGKNGPYIGKTGIKEYRFSREIAVAQMIITSLFFREGAKFSRARYEDIYEFLRKKENSDFNTTVKEKTNKIHSILKKTEDIFGKKASKLKRKSVILSAYLFCEEKIEKGDGNSLKVFPVFYIKLLEEMEQQSKLINKYQIPNKKILLDRFQRNLQQASSEGYSIEARHKFLGEAFAYYIRTKEIIGDDA